MTKKDETEDNPPEPTGPEYERAREQLVHAEKFAAVGLLAAEIAHEINNPSTFVITNLTVMMDYVDTIDRFHDALRSELGQGDLTLERFDELARRHEIAFLSEDLHSLLERSLSGLNRIHQVVQDLKYFSQDRRPNLTWVDVGGLVRAAANLVRHEARLRARFVLELPEIPVAYTDPNRLSQVLLNVLVNAVQAVPAGAPDRNEVRVQARADADNISLTVTDTGEGIPPDLLPRIFEPFFTTKSPGEGTGLGLSISRDIMRALGGDIWAESEPSSGSTFHLRIPRGNTPDE